MTGQFTRHLQHHDEPLRVPRAGAVSWDDEALHTEAHRADPERYALQALIPGVPAGPRPPLPLRLLPPPLARRDARLRAAAHPGTPGLAPGPPPAGRPSVTSSH